MIPITWPFTVWGLDLVGPLKKAPGGFTHLLDTIDKFTKWIEARPISTIKSEQAVLFFLDIIHRFGLHYHRQRHAVHRQEIHSIL